nr:hypothetical protein CTI12_AA019290 [Tanacetum cinerariifolium]
TYLRVGDIDLTVIDDENIALPGRVVDFLEIEKENENLEFKMQDISASMLRCLMESVRRTLFFVFSGAGTITL